MSEQIIFRNVVTAPRWSDLSSYIRVGCDILGLELRYLTVNKGWIRETITFAVSGPVADVRKFETRMQADMEEYNE
jgi:hypothetical protein